MMTNTYVIHKVTLNYYINYIPNFMEKNEKLIRKMYNVLLHRDPESEGLKNYCQHLNNNVPLFKLITEICSSEEFLNCQMNLIKNDTPTVFHLQNCVDDYEHDLNCLDKQLSTTNDLFEQNCLQIEHLQNENQNLKLLVNYANKTQKHITLTKKNAFTQTNDEYINFQMPIKIRRQLINKIEPKINVFMCVRNNENSLKDTFETLLSLKTNQRIKINFFIYENDSKDNTPFMLLDFYRNNNVEGAYTIETLDKKEWRDSRHIDRSADMAIYRNKMKNLCSNFNNSDYSLILDTDVEFTPKTFFDMIKLLISNSNIAMVTPYACVNNTLTYYDTYALDSPKNINVCMPEIQEVYSAFGGFVMIRSSVLKECHWDVTPDKVCSEHNYFCKMVRQYGKIVIARDIRVRWKNKFLLKHKANN